MKEGAFTFVLHGHVPFCRRDGRWPQGEEWLHEALTDTYLPLLVALYELKDEGCPFHLSLALSPALVEQMADRAVLEHFESYLRDRIARAASDVKRFEKETHGHLLYLSGFYLTHYEKLLHAFTDRFRRDMVGAFAALQNEGNLEIIAGAATHAYLPLLGRDSSVHAQLAVGVDSYRRHFKREPHSVWLPECGYRPSVNTGIRRPGIENFIEQLGLRLTFVGTHAFEGGDPAGKLLGDVIGPYGEIARRLVAPPFAVAQPKPGSPSLPYRVGSSKVAALANNSRAALQVWSDEWGYPLDYNYRESGKRDGLSGLEYWRVTGARIEPEAKDFYDPYWAQRRAVEHAEHYCGMVNSLLSDYYRHTARFGIVTAAFDCNLFGQWWFEGITWLKEVLKKMAASNACELTTAGRFVDEHPPESSLSLPESSWGQGGGHFTWMNVDTEWMWPLIHEAEVKMEDLVARFPDAGDDMAPILRQAARELLLLQASDWQFLIASNQARQYAASRFLVHFERFQKLANTALTSETGDAARSTCSDLLERDRIFPDIDYRVFANRERMN